MTDKTGIALAAALLSAAGSLVEGIDAGTRSLGFDDLRPAHGFVFARLAPNGATGAELAKHLGVTKQAVSQLVGELVEKGYITKKPHPTDARAQLLVLTDRGWDATRAADRASAEVVAAWARQIGPGRITELTRDLAALAPPGRLRPFW